MAPLIEDPWRVFPCSGEPAGCTASFEDPEFAAVGRETVYYVRAIQEPTPAVNGDPMRCIRDASGRCTAARECAGTGRIGGGEVDDCLAPVEERAWSSPLFVRPQG